MAISSWSAGLNDKTPAKDNKSLKPVGELGALNYSPNSAGSVDLPIGCLCPESKAAGGAVTCVQADKHCQGVQGIRIIVGDKASGLHAAVDKVNYNFHCDGRQPRMATNLLLSRIG